MLQALATAWRSDFAFALRIAHAGACQRLRSPSERTFIPSDLTVLATATVARNKRTIGVFCWSPSLARIEQRHTHAHGERLMTTCKTMTIVLLGSANSLRSILISARQTILAFCPARGRRMLDAHARG